MTRNGEQHTTITVPEIAQRLGVCAETVYGMLKSKEIPNIRYGHRFIISRKAYEHCKRPDRAAERSVKERSKPEE